MQRQMGSAAASSCMRGAPTAGSRGTWQMELLWQSRFCEVQRWQSGAALQQCHCYLQGPLHISLLASMPNLLHHARQLPRSGGVYSSSMRCAAAPRLLLCDLSSILYRLLWAELGQYTVNAPAVGQPLLMPSLLEAAMGQLACLKCSHSKWHQLQRRALHGVQGLPSTLVRPAGSLHKAAVQSGIHQLLCSGLQGRSAFGCAQGLLGSLPRATWQQMLRFA